MCSRAGQLLELAALLLDRGPKTQGRAAQLELWAERILDEETLEAVLAAES
ncbi:MAG: hypothetical protein RBU37_25040 [Myxococcota bacterium]|nr:hypothetical protein [Myxococcota bacterium]